MRLCPAFVYVNGIAGIVHSAQHGNSDVFGNNVVFGIGQAYTVARPVMVTARLTLPDTRITTDCPTPTLIELAGACCFKSALKKSTHPMSYGPSTAVMVYQMLKASTVSAAA